MNKLKSLKEIRQALGRVLFNFEEVTTSDGLIITYTGELAVGAKVYTYDEAGETIPLPDGTYELGVVGSIVVVGGEVTEIIKPNDATAPTDNTVDPTNDFKVQLEKMENKFNAKLAEFGTILQSILAKYEEFSVQVVDKPVEKKVVVEDVKTSDSKATKYFK